MAENSILMLAMLEEVVVLILLLTVFSYLLLERKHIIKLWNKCKPLIFYYNTKYRYVMQSLPRHLSLLEFAQWQYRGEGNEYLAISLPEQRKILRLRKSICAKGFISNVKDWYNHHINVITEETRAAYFEKLNLEYYKVLVKLIGECYVQPSEEILLKRSEINKVNKIIASSRPEYRKKKQIGFTCGSLLTDYAYLPIEWDISQFSGPTFAIEIKPKQGWIPESERNYQLCTYCLNQYIKLQNGETAAISNYCPMDLFSGKIDRMNYAIKCLLKMPQNNIKIFLEGLLIYGENNDQKLREAMNNIFEDTPIEKSTNEFCDLITKALLKQIHNSNNHNCSTIDHSNNNLNNFHNKLKACDLNSNELPRGCVLERILNLQQLDLWGAEKVNEFLKDLPDSYKENNYNHASSVVTRAKKNANFHCVKCFFNENDGNIDTIVQKYIMSAIAKDCSLILTFRKLNNEFVNIPEQNLLRTELGLYAFNIGVFDLYPKPLSCIFKHVRKRIKFSDIYKLITNESNF